MYYFKHFDRFNKLGCRVYIDRLFIIAYKSKLGAPITRTIGWKMVHSNIILVLFTAEFSLD